MKKPPARHHVVLVVVYSLALVLLIYACTLSACALMKVSPPPELIAALKDVGLVSGGALTGLLARTSSEDPSTPQKTEVVNTTANPVPTTEST